jgi:hypothetical protein
MSEPGYPPPPPPSEPPPPGDLYGGPPSTPPGPPGGAAVPPLPWEDRDRIGFFPALFETVKLFVTSPTEAYARAKERGDYLSPLLFAVIIGWVMGIIGQLWNLLFQGAWLSMIPADFRDQMGAMGMGASSAAGFVLGLILTPVIIVVVVFIWSGIVHLFLMMLGGHKQSASGFEGTFRAIAYAQTASLAQIIPIPVIGGLIALVWSIVLYVIGLVRMHRTSTGKAAGAVLLPIVLCCVCIGLGAVLIGILGASALSGMFSGMSEN